MYNCDTTYPEITIGGFITEKILKLTNRKETIIFIMLMKRFGEDEIIEVQIDVYFGNFREI